jgi:2-polyprenyl-6-methoxyphenol hydroxylase-like FAD-dependent oxidoreductase
VIPTNGGICLFASLPPARFREERRQGLEDIYHRVMKQVAPDVAAKLGKVERTGKLRGFPGVAGFLRRSVGDGWALVGDAGFFRDPLTAHGITDALRDAELLARAVVGGDGGALESYQDTRDRYAVGMLEVTDEVASFGWDLEQIQEIHLRLSKEMNREVELLRGLEPAGAVEVA